MGEVFLHVDFPCDTVLPCTLLYSCSTRSKHDTKAQVGLDWRIYRLHLFMCWQREWQHSTIRECHCLFAQASVCITCWKKQTNNQLFWWGCMLTGPVCGKLDASQKNVTLKSNEVSVSFKSGPHRSGRGFLLSYATDQHPGMIFVTGWLLFVKCLRGYDQYMHIFVCVVTLLLSYCCL